MKKLIILMCMIFFSFTFISGVVCNETYSPCGGGCPETNLNSMFSGVTNFDTTIGNISGWNVSCIDYMNSMFNNATDFNQDLSSWDVSGVQEINFMFKGATSFNGNVSGWSFISFGETFGMFQGATSFNQDLSSWDVSTIQDMSNMFQNAISFNQDISNWDVSNVGDMPNIFNGATSFNQDLGSWDVSAVEDMGNMFNGVTLSTENYDSLLNGWALLSLESFVDFSGGNSKYSEAGLSSRNDTLIGTYNWSIIDGGFIDLNSPMVTSLVENPTSPTIAGGIYQFNATIIDFSNFTALLEFNGINYSTTNVSSVYSVSLSGIGTGNHNFKWIAIDDFGNINNSEGGTYIINSFEGEIQGTGALYNIIRSTGAGLGKLFVYLSVSLPILMLGLMIVGIFIIIGVAIVQIVNKINIRQSE